MKTEETNKLIAEFMNYTIRENNKITIPNIGTFPIQDIFKKIKNDWNWLMEVVEKIESLGYKTSIIKSMQSLHIMLVKDYKDNHYREHSAFEVEQTLYAKTKIEAVYNACVTFIEWYNSAQEK